MEMLEIAALIEPQIPGLRRYAYALLREPAGADDLVQDCLERAVARWPSRREDGDVRAWLFSILHNQFISFRRQQKRRRWQQNNAGAELGETGAQHDALLSRDMQRCLEALSDEHRAVLLLAGVEALPYKEIAYIIGVPVGTVMSRLSRARERFRSLMDGELPARDNTVAYLRRVE